ncbi:hypothetical protein [Pseudoprimorskyibacter insulae]|uniref:Uncharacterized protein n=1 Tax=Pseudoprimorskyibacter insulae TaxID=1695997 RepID=A0A2R8B0I3_9RHOB|nr:hypothetical protein [Pseudoprimorskyibacter insulae]SPF81793.1 hypothetical protein PRI8871_03618 [Pseudoprimorskyibacter insulae]
MHLSFTPMRRDDALTLTCEGETLYFNGVALDLSAIADGACLAASDLGCDWLAGDVCRTGGALHVSVILPHGARAPQQTLFPAPVTVVADGPVPLPPYDLPPDPGPEV